MGKKKTKAEVALENALKALSTSRTNRELATGLVQLALNAVTNGRDGDYLVTPTAAANRKGLSNVTIHRAIHEGELTGLPVWGEREDRPAAQAVLLSDAEAFVPKRMRESAEE